MRLPGHVDEYDAVVERYGRKIGLTWNPGAEVYFSRTWGVVMTKKELDDANAVQD